MEISEAFTTIAQEHNIQSSDIITSNSERLEFKKGTIVFTIVYIAGTKIPYHMQWVTGDGEIYSYNGGLESQEDVCEIIQLVIENFKNRR